MLVCEVATQKHSLNSIPLQDTMLSDYLQQSPIKMIIKMTESSDKNSIDSPVL